VRLDSRDTTPAECRDRDVQFRIGAGVVPRAAASGTGAAWSSIRSTCLGIEHDHFAENGNLDLATSILYWIFDGSWGGAGCLARGLLHSSSSRIETWFRPLVGGSARVEPRRLI
jgi:hypothetical protein